MVNAESSGLVDVTCGMKQLTDMTEFPSLFDEPSLGVLRGDRAEA